MLTNVIGNWAAKGARSKLNGYRTLIGGIALILYGLSVGIGLVFPEYSIPNSDMDWSMVIDTIQQGIGLAGLYFTADGVMGKAYKAGVDTKPPSYSVSDKTGPVDVIFEPMRKIG